MTITRVYFLIIPSRIRLFQWKLDLNWFLYFLVDSLLLLLNNNKRFSGNYKENYINWYKSILRQENNNNDYNSNNYNSYISDNNSDYNQHKQLVQELNTMLKFLLLMIYVMFENNESGSINLCLFKKDLSNFNQP